MRYVVMEFEGRKMDNEVKHLVRVDGYYTDEETAKEIARMWASETTPRSSTIIAAKVVLDATKERDET